MLLTYFILSIAVAAAVFTASSGKAARAVGWGFYLLQAAFAAWMAAGNGGRTEMQFFTLDDAGMLFFVLMALISPVVYYYGFSYLDTETLREKRMYNALLILMCASMTGVYFSNNIAVTWIFLEATTLCTAGIVYHRRSQRSLEATWKYIFVCSVGIAIAYLGILLLGGVASGGDMGYASLAANIASGNPLFLKLAFLFIVAGYSCKMEVFPLYTIGVDANMVSPTPASALISTGLVNAGFISVYRIYKVMEHSEVFEWVSGVLVAAGLLSVAMAAVFINRSNHYKRLLAYSTVENMGLAAIGLGIGGAGVFAALFLVAGHSLLKSTIFLQMTSVGKAFGHYRISRTGGFMNVNRRGGVILLVTTVLLLAFPPSPLFIAEVMLFKQMIINRQWWLLASLVILLCTIIYSFGRDILKLCYGKGQEPTGRNETPPGRYIPVFVIVVAAVVAGIYQPEWLKDFFGSVARM